MPAAFERGVQKVLITHPFFKVPALELDTLQELTRMGAYAEFGYCTVSPMWNHAALTRVVEAIKAIGPEQAILMSDAGQRHNPMPAECLRVFAQSVFESGVSEDDVERMIKHNPPICSISARYPTSRRSRRRTGVPTASSPPSRWCEG